MRGDPMSRFAAFALLLAAGCGGTPGSSPARIRSEHALNCDALAADLEQVDVDASTEGELVSAMELADTSSQTCRDAFLDEARSDAERVIANHRARQMAVHARYFEASLASRFDGGANFCDIISEALNLLLTDAVEIENALADDTMGRADHDMLVQLRDLDLEAIDVLMLTAESACSPGVTVSP